jgi:hypothetical protein
MVSCRSLLVDATSLRVGRIERRRASIMASANVPADKFVKKFVVADAYRLPKFRHCHEISE